MNYIREVELWKCKNCGYIGFDTKWNRVYNKSDKNELIAVEECPECISVEHEKLNNGTRL